MITSGFTPAASCAEYFLGRVFEEENREVTSLERLSLAESPGPAGAGAFAEAAISLTRWKPQNGQNLELSGKVALQERQFIGASLKLKT
jgi:hypothetical protein